VRARQRGSAEEHDLRSGDAFESGKEMADEVIAGDLHVVGTEPAGDVAAVIGMQHDLNR
jgi:hypothetical protein